MQVNFVEYVVNKEISSCRRTSSHSTEPINVTGACHSYWYSYEWLAIDFHKLLVSWRTRGDDTDRNYWKIDHEVRGRVSFGVMRSVPRARLVLIIFLNLLFGVLSFNAQACLLPLFGTTAASMQSGCSTPEASPIRQFCDAFKMLSVQAPLDSNPELDSQSVSEDAPISLIHMLNHPPATQLSCDYPAHSPPEDVLLKTQVLRI